MGHETGENGWHDEVRDSTAGIAESACQRIGSSNNVLVEKTCAPDLAWHEAAAENTNEETESHEAGGVRNEASHERWDGTSKQACGECVSWANGVAHGACN